ncbi:M15 family metallopeptidase [Microbacterium sp. KUDC0406]|uniref:M15 family metallopeptidase n=1 Tax=Microbacterium sp. KUDC0406 TaxID=2909588 RepID=UPI001F21FA98|nr:M15 family metallopeptidase [Microbacterium sp. KUDC0406]UJP09333.1 M15 family metallopeptidase [Microbacterium sp. KUDC0406]
MSTLAQRPRAPFALVAALVLALLGLVMIATGVIVQTNTAAPDAGTPGGEPASAASATSEVVDGPASPFDDTNPTVARLDPELRGALREAATAAQLDGVEMVVNSGWRTPERQEQLLSDAISTYGSREAAARWVAPADKSSHVHGEAVDVGDLDAAIWLGDHGREFGLCQTYANERWHFEYRASAPRKGCPAAYPDPTYDPRLQ